MAQKKCNDKGTERTEFSFLHLLRKYNNKKKGGSKALLGFTRVEVQERVKKQRAKDVTEAGRHDQRVSAREKVALRLHPRPRQGPEGEHPLGPVSQGNPKLV